MKTVSIGKWLGYIFRAAGILGLLTFALYTQAAGDINAQCQRCHSDSDIHAVTPDKSGAKLLITDESYQDSVHAKVPCVACHQSVNGNAGFEALPHVQTTVASNSCESCHGLIQHKITDAYKKSVHATKIDQGKFTCESCHDAHTMQAGIITQPTAQQITASNAMCTDCHTRPTVYKTLSGGKKVTEQDLTHQSLPNPPLHLSSLRCIDCHASSQDTSLHNIAPAKESLTCKQCHSEESLLIQRQNFTPVEQNLAGSLLNQGLFDDKALQDKLNALGGIPAEKQIQWVKGTLFTNTYMIGANGDIRWDKTIITLTGGLFLLLFGHGLIRLVTASKRRSLTAAMSWHKTYLYTLPVRVWHWLNALCFILLLVSGVGMHFAQGELATWVDLHNFVGIALCLIWLMFILINLLGTGHQYIIRLSGLLGRIYRQTRYYLYGIFTGAEHPEHPTANNKFNPLQQLGYVAVMYLVVPLLIVTGLLMLYSDYTPATLFGLPGKLVVAYTHYGLAAISLLFLLVHLYLCTTGDSLSALFKGMVDGYHRYKSKGDKH